MNFRQGFTAGYECLAAWADLLDRINVFPVADGDTGANLRISLAPLRDHTTDFQATLTQLARCATGNSGNIAAAYFREFCRADGALDLAEKAALGRDKARQAIANPCAGTMLTVFDSLSEALDAQTGPEINFSHLCKQLRQAVLTTADIQPELRAAGVVDSGALAMFIFFEEFFRHITKQPDGADSILDQFKGSLEIDSAFQAIPVDGYCVDVLIQPEAEQHVSDERLAELGESVVVVPDESRLKVHIHTPDPTGLRNQLNTFAEVLDWSDEPIEQVAVKPFSEPAESQCVHLMTDSAGSMTREMARQHSISLLDSYIIAADHSRPESLYNAEDVYALMRAGQRVTTAQASTFERHHHYQRVCSQYRKTLYLCVGSAFTGNYATAIAWKEHNDPENRLEVLDTGAASGRLGLIAMLAARQARRTDSPELVIDFARKAMSNCMEYVFIDELKYLVAGGRVSKAGGFFGDLLNMKPVVSPTSEGVRKVGVVRSQKGQLDFALKQLDKLFDASVTPFILLQYSDNKEWVQSTIQQQLQDLLPKAEILLIPLSLSSGVHMGPGTWSLAFSRAF